MAKEFIINGDDLAGYTPYEGDGWPDLLPADGIFKVKIAKVSAEEFGEDKKGGFKLGLLTLDEDCAGNKLLSNVLATGKDKNDDPMARQLGDVLMSLGSSTEKIRGWKGKKVKSGDVIKLLLGKEGYVQAARTSYKDDSGVKHVYSEVTNWRTPAQYEEAKAVGGHRKRRADNEELGRDRRKASANGMAAETLGDSAVLGDKATGADDVLDLV